MADELNLRKSSYGSLPTAPLYFHRRLDLSTQFRLLCPDIVSNMFRLRHATKYNGLSMNSPRTHNLIALKIVLVVVLLARTTIAAEAALPQVQMLLPGFQVRELPIDLPNINNLRYRRDGQLYALGYNGDVWLLSDTNADGCEETTRRFFDNQSRLRGPIGMAVIPDNHSLLAHTVKNGSTIGQGIIVASKGKVSAILDLDGDDIAEEERVIASGWVEIPQNVDAVGVAISPVDNSIYFGIGVKDYNNAYQVDKNGIAHYDNTTERGTIQRIAPDLSSRETVCRGVRFTIGLGFDQHHELFATDQEGATWLANGNPFDELLHIQTNKRYGFPPRHPSHLPHVFDEPSLFDYRPQHQSTCGLAFNLPMNELGPVFGPSNWRGDAFVCGQSRGKLYRNKLVRDEQGRYLTENQLIGCLGMLSVDCCLSPRGDLLVACHSGGPDWGSGPSGKGKIFQIRYDETGSAIPIAAWSSGPQEVRVEMDRPISVLELKELASKASIEFGEFVAAGDRFESIRPGYAVTKIQQSVIRESLPIYSAAVTADQRTLVFQTGRYSQPVSYALRLPGLGRERPTAPWITQESAVDLAFSLQGVQATWRSTTDRNLSWMGRLPVLDLEAAKALTANGLSVSKLWNLIEGPGTLVLATQLNPSGLFYPSVQTSSQLDYDPDQDKFITYSGFELHSDSIFSWGHSEENLSLAAKDLNGYRASIQVKDRFSKPIPVVVKTSTGPKSSSVRVDWVVRTSSHSQLNHDTASNNTANGVLHVDRFLLPWANVDFKKEVRNSESAIQASEIAGANWGRGRQVFYGEQAGCYKCHQIEKNQFRITTNGIGPDLTNLVHRDYASVYRDVTNPSFAINPDFISYSVRLKDDRVLVGSLRSEGETILLSDREAKVTKLTREEIDEIKPSTLSVMPEGLLDQLGASKIKDLMCFLLTSPPHMPIEPSLAATRQRSRSEVLSVLNAGSKRDSLSSKADEPPKPLRILLVAGKKDHGPGEHDYPAWLTMWSSLMSAANNVTVDTAMEWPNSEQLSTADSIVFFQKGAWTTERAAAIDQHLRKGGGLVYIHWAIEGGKNAPEFAKRIGLASDASMTKYRHGELELKFAIKTDHPITRGFDRLDILDESYWNLQGASQGITALGISLEASENHPQFWTVEPYAGRVFVSIPGHYSTSFDDPLFRLLLLRGIAWSVKEREQRFDELALIGVELVQD